jgi:alkaline phosphatase
MKPKSENRNPNSIRIALPWLLLTGVVLSFGCAGGRNATVGQVEVPKNIIFFIADGCGYNQVDAASYYTFGKTGKQSFEQFPIRYGMSTYPIDGNGYDPDSAWASFDYHKKKTTDSAASATAMSTGFKTYNGAIAVDTSKTPLVTIVELVEQKGKATGVVSSVTFAHATPASFVAHNESRGNYEAIAREMILESPVDVIMGCGHPSYDSNGGAKNQTDYKYVGGEATWLALKEGRAQNDADGDGDPDTWTLIEDRAQFQQMMRGKTPKRVIGVPKVFDTLQKNRDGDRNAEPYVVPLTGTVPTLQEMVVAAINVLDDDPDGFFVMVEGGAVDWASHDNLSGRVIEEKIDFDNAINAAIEWVESNSSWQETLVIVTGDHETGYLNGPGSNPLQGMVTGKPDDIWKPLVNNGKGRQPGMAWYSGGHTNSLIPFYAKGPGSDGFKAFVKGRDPVRGEYIDNADIGKLLISLYE